MRTRALVQTLQLTFQTMRNIYEYLTEWDEWSEIEKGYGPKASRSGEICNTTSGAITESLDSSRLASATPSETTVIKNGKCVSVTNFKNVDLDDDGLLAFPSMPCTSTADPHHRTKVPEGGLGAKLCHHGRWEEPKSNRIPKPKKPCSKNGKGSVIKVSLIFQWFESMMKSQQKPRKTKKDKKEVHMARVHGICVEKN